MERIGEKEKQHNLDDFYKNDRMIRFLLYRGFKELCKDLETPEKYGNVLSVIANSIL